MTHDCITQPQITYCLTQYTSWLGHRVMPHDCITQYVHKYIIQYTPWLVHTVMPYDCTTKWWPMMVWPCGVPWLYHHVVSRGCISDVSLLHHPLLCHDCITIAQHVTTVSLIGHMTLSPSDVPWHRVCIKTEICVLFPNVPDRTPFSQSWRDPGPRILIFKFVEHYFRTPIFKTKIPPTKTVRCQDSAFEFTSANPGECITQWSITVYYPVISY